MATIYNDDIIDIDLNCGTITRGFTNKAIGYADKNGNRYGVNVKRDGQPVQLTGCTCLGFFIRHADGATITIMGAVNENTAYVILPEACYALEGSFSLAIKICSTDNSIEGTKRIVDGTVVMTDTGTYIDPGTIMPDIQTLLDAIEEAVESIPPDYSSLNTAITYSGRSGEVVLPNYVYTVQGILSPDGTSVSTIGNWHTTDYIPILCQDIYFRDTFFESLAYSSFCLYDESFTPIYIPRGKVSFYASEYPTAKYFRASADISYEDTAPHVVIGNRRAWYYTSEMTGIFTSTTPTKLPSDLYHFEGIISGDGTSIADSTASLRDFLTTDYIEIPCKHLYFSGGFFGAEAYRSFVLYDSTKTPVAFGLGNQVISLDDYPTAKYFRAAKVAANEDLFVEISTVNPADIKREFHVGTGQQFTRLRDGISEACKHKDSKLYVHPGTYDLSQEFATEISAQGSSAIGNYLSNGIHIIFESGAYVTALFPTSNSFIDAYFNPFYGKDFTLEGLVIEASNCRYCVHDEQAAGNYYYHNIIKNCQMKMTANGTTGTHGQCIGGGLGKHGYIEITGGRYETYATDTPCISYHNGGLEGMDSKIFIRDVYCDGTDGNIEMYNHGPSTVKTQVYISGCSLKSNIDLPAPSSGDPVNMEITEWNNTIRGE